MAEVALGALRSVEREHLRDALVYLDSGAQDCVLTAGGLRALQQHYGARSCIEFESASPGDLRASAFLMRSPTRRVCFILTQPLSDHAAELLRSACASLRSDGFTGSASVLCSVSEDAHPSSFGDGVYAQRARLLVNVFHSSNDYPARPLPESSAESWNAAWDSDEDWDEIDALKAPRSSAEGVSWPSGADSHLDSAQGRSGRRSTLTSTPLSDLESAESGSGVSVNVDYIPLHACALTSEAFVLPHAPISVGACTSIGCCSDTSVSEQQEGDLHALSGIACALGARRIECFGLGEDGAELSRQLASTTPPAPPANDPSDSSSASILVIGRRADLATPCMPSDSALSEIMQHPHAAASSGTVCTALNAHVGLVNTIQESVSPSSTRYSVNDNLLGPDMTGKASNYTMSHEDLRDVFFEGSDHGSTYRDLLMSSSLESAAQTISSWIGEKHDESSDPCSKAIKVCDKSVKQSSEARIIRPLRAVPCRTSKSRECMTLMRTPHIMTGWPPAPAVFSPPCMRLTLLHAALAHLAHTTCANAPKRLHQVIPTIGAGCGSKMRKRCVQQRWNEARRRWHSV